MRTRGTVTLRTAGVCALILTAAPGRAADGGSAPAVEADRIDLPKGVRFKPGPAAGNDAARKRLEAAFAAPDSAALTSLLDTAFVVCGPGLWQWLRQAPGADRIGKPSTMFVPNSPTLKDMQPLQGRSYVDKAAARGFLRVFRAGLPASEPPVVRRPTRLEIALLWAMVPFDLEDPLFVVETGGHHLIVVMGDKGKHIQWIDDMAGMYFPPDKGVALPAPPPYVARAPR